MPTIYFAIAYCTNNIGQKLTRVARQQTKGKAERVIPHVDGDVAR